MNESVQKLKDSIEKRIVGKGDVIEMDIDRDWTDEEYHITMSAE